MKKLFLIFFFSLFNFSLCFENIRKLESNGNITVSEIKFKYNKLIIKGNYTEGNLKNETAAILNFENFENSSIVNQTLNCEFYNETNITYNMECELIKNIYSNFNSSTINLTSNNITLDIYIKDIQNLTYNHNSTRLLAFGDFQSTNDNKGSNLKAYFVKPKDFTGINNLFFKAYITYKDKSVGTLSLSGNETKENIGDTLVYYISFNHAQPIASLISLKDYCITDNELDNITYCNGVINDDNNDDMYKNDKIIIFNNSKIINQYPLTIQGNYSNVLSLKSEKNDNLFDLTYYENETPNNITCTMGVNNNDKTYTIYCVVTKKTQGNLLGAKGVSQIY